MNLYKKSINFIQRGYTRTFSQFCLEFFSSVVDGVWIPWSVWRECDVSCGGGIQFRNRTCHGPFYNGSDCSGEDLQNRTCNDFNCPGSILIVLKSQKTTVAYYKGLKWL